ncbi:glycosyltransferase [Imperialibacter roseus]|uniref:Glycosyltransferase n=1 Tax=Imperialibacter roseus TaxID=1324217 RepID=A0ABZ0IMM1_9BACT|nr:glycosyltransferase [Imperialibacter roseus]WOK06283.1 glycosyltransferase [Imperialibacter roseus]
MTQIKKTPLRILWIAPYPSNPSAHAAPWVTSLAQALVTSGEAELTILSTSPTLAAADIEIKKDGYKVVLLKTLSPKLDIVTFYFFRILTLRRWLKKNVQLFDLVHIHGTEHQFEIAASNLGIPTVVSIQGLLFKYYSRLPEAISSKKAIWALGSLYERFGIKNHSNFICRTHWDTSSVQALNPRAKIFIAWEMIREEFFIDEDIAFTDNESILFLGGLNSIKGIKEALLSFDSIAQASSLKLNIFGDGDTRGLENLIATMELVNCKPGVNIFHMGRAGAKQIVDEMKKSRLLLHPSYIDNSPNSICEAQVVGLPVVATNVGGVSSLINQVETGILVELEVLSIVDGIKMIIDDKPLSERISKNSRYLARQRHNPNTVRRDYLSIYSKLLTHA